MSILKNCPVGERRNPLQSRARFPIVLPELTVSEFMPHYSDKSIFSPARDLRGLSLLALRLLLPLRG